MRTGHENSARIAEIAKFVRAAALGGATFLALGAPAVHAAPRSASSVNEPGAPATAAMPSDNSALLQTAQRQFNAGNYSAAITTLQSAITQNSSSTEAYYWLGRTYYEIRDYDNAIAAGEKSIALDPKNSVYHQWLGRIYGGKADRDRSFSYARKVKKEFETAV